MLDEDPNQEPDSARMQTFPIVVMPLQLARSISLQQIFDLPRMEARSPSLKTAVVLTFVTTWTRTKSCRSVNGE